MRDFREIWSPIDQTKKVKFANNNIDTISEKWAENNTVICLNLTFYSHLY